MTSFLNRPKWKIIKLVKVEEILKKVQWNSNFEIFYKFYLKIYSNFCNFEEIHFMISSSTNFECYNLNLIAWFKSHSVILWNLQVKSFGCSRQSPTRFPSIISIKLRCFFTDSLSFHRIRVRSWLHVHQRLWTWLLWVLHSIESLRNVGKEQFARRFSQKSNRKSLAVDLFRWYRTIYFLI